MRKIITALVLSIALGTSAQSPGGVDGNELWFKVAPLTAGGYKHQNIVANHIWKVQLTSSACFLQSILRKIGKNDAINIVYNRSIAITQKQTR